LIPNEQEDLPMANEKRGSAPDAVSANRAQTQGLGVGQEELSAQRVADQELHAIDPQRTEPFDQSLERTTNADRPSEADFSGQEPDDVRARGERRDFRSNDLSGEAAVDDVAADLALGGVDARNLGQRDNPQEDWGQPAGDGATFSSNHSRRAVRVEAERAQGSKTRRATKDIISRRT
jgi:hypothetical protein